jgi:hypothetical protein
MKSAVLWLISFVVSGVLVNLLSSQIDAWLPIWALRLVKHQARQMGSRADRCAEEWQADLAQKHGSLAKFCFALGTLLVPLRTRIERGCDAAGGLRPALGAWLQDQAWLITLPAIATLLAAYPPHKSRYAAYAVFIPLILVCAASLSPRFCRGFAGFYEARSFAGRVAMGSLPSLAFWYFVIFIGLVPPSGEGANRSAPHYGRAAKPMVVVMPSLPVDVDRRQASASTELNEITRVKLLPMTPEPVFRGHAVERNEDAQRIHRRQSSNVQLPFSPLPETLILHGVKNPSVSELPHIYQITPQIRTFDLSELLILGPQQPLPSPQLVVTPLPLGTPRPPVNIRLVAR